MPAYIQGNLAVKPKEIQEQRINRKESNKLVRRAKTLPVQEKLLYLFTVVLCVAVAGVIIWRYAEIYEMSVDIKRIETKIVQLEAENLKLKQQVDALSDPQHLQKMAEKYNMITMVEQQELQRKNKQTVKAAGMNQ